MKTTKQYFIVLTAAVLLAACNNDADSPSGEGYLPSDRAITFDASEEEAATRANGMMDDDVLKQKGFGVFGSYTGKLTYENTTVSSDFMYNQQVTYNTTGNVWEYQPLKYWPNTPTDYVSFFAYAPYEATPRDDGRCIIDMSKREDLGDPWLNYRIADNPWSTVQPQVDLLYGQREDGTSWLDQQKYNYDAAPLKFIFRHALGCIGDKITIRMASDLSTLITGYASITVTNVTVNYKNLTTKGRLVLRSEGSANWKEIISGEITTTRTYNKDVNLTFTPPSTEEQTISQGDGLFYIPLQVAGTDAPCAEVTIAYTVTNNANHAYSGTASTTFPLDMNLEGKKQGIALQLTKSLDLQHLVYEIDTSATEPSYSRKR